MTDGNSFWVRSLAETYPSGGRIHQHQHTWGQLAYAISGVMHIETPSALWITPPTRAVWIPPRMPHEISFQGATAMRTLYIGADYAERLPTEEAVFEVAPLLRELILHILGVGMLGPGEASHERLAGLVIDLLVEAPRTDLSLPLPKDRRARAMADQIKAQLCSAVGLAEMARHAGASLRTLQRLFPDETGLTLDAWRQKARLTAAVAALSSGTPVALAAADCGYESPSAFIGAFKRHFRTTPGRYRAALAI